ncbi:uncharacterized protein LOC126983125 [Eriocheir sinensis]|uniref:uncharacterized protein LOC126983125 n=1 Tax=Eriocheir sinensis TaxID=95602 RepID=UPI0021C60B16|nr:uncharacterized protein LOC126983125 [Eriocheir sinensis]
MQWNVCGVRGKVNLLRAAIGTDGFDVILLQETLLREGQSVPFKGYRAFYLPAVAGAARGCCILVRDVLPCSRVHRPVLCGAGVEVLAVKVTLPSACVAFYCVYSGPRAEPDFTELLSLANDEPTFIGGDFNAHHERWGSGGRNRAGRHLASALEDVPGVALLNTGVPTHMAGGVLDLSFVSQPLAVGATWTLHPHLASDHFASVIALPVPPPVLPQRPPRWNLRRADWPRFRGAVARRLAATIRPDDLEAADERLVDAFTAAADESIPLLRPVAVIHRERWYYTEEVREANHRVNQARKLNRRVNTEATRGLLRAAVRRVRETADRVQEEHWLAWCEGLDGCTSAAVLWRKLRAVAGGAVARPALHPQPQAEAERLVATFSSRAASARLPVHTRDLLREANPGRVAAFREACLQAHATDAPIELWELERSIPRKDTATGVNRIPYSFLANAGPDMQAEVLGLFNTSLELGALPASWKLATIVPIPKSGDGLQHRPISLLSCLGKCMERVLLPRLQWAMGSLHHHLFAFRRGRGTRDCISTLLSGVLGRRAVVVFIDLEKAFELASAPAMLSILAERGVRGRLLAWVGHYLEGRRAAVRFQGHTSAIETFENGTPQGGVLSPVLFNLLVEKLTSLPTSGNARVLSYADDVALVVWGPNHVACARQLLRRLNQTCAALGLVVNRTKTRAMAFRHGHLPEPFDLEGTPVPWVHTYKYLGVTVDSSLSFGPHIARVRDEVRRRTNVMRALARTAGVAGNRVLRTFYVQDVRSCIDYGTPCLLTVGPVALRPLETAQNAALRVIVGAPMWTKCVCSVAARVTQLSVGHLAALLRRMGAEQLRASVGQALLQDPLLFRKITWATVAAATIRRSGLPHALATAVDAPHPTYVARPPWEPPALTATIRPLAKRKALLTPLELAREADNGSVNHQTGAVGAASVCDGATAVYRLPDGCSSTQAELAAIGGALDHAVEGGRGPVLIHCDSVPAIRSLLQDPPRDNVSLLTSILARLAELRGAGRPVKVNWLPSHSGVAGTEAADGAAAEATLLPAVTRPVVVSLAQVKRDMAARSATGVVRELEEALAAGSPSAYWYSAATNTGARQPPPNLPRRETSNIRRLRLGYKCASVLHPDDPAPVVCPYCEEEAPPNHAATSAVSALPGTASTSNAAPAASFPATPGTAPPSHPESAASGPSTLKVLGLPTAGFDTALDLAEGKPVTLRQVGEATTKGVMTAYPVAMPLKALLRHPDVLSADRCLTRDGLATRQVMITLKGPLPGSLDLGSWGVFYTRPFNKEPLRCYFCQQFRHHCSRSTLASEDHFPSLLPPRATRATTPTTAAPPAPQPRADAIKPSTSTPASQSHPASTSGPSQRQHRAPTPPPPPPMAQRKHRRRNCQSVSSTPREAVMDTDAPEAPATQSSPPGQTSVTFAIGRSPPRSHVPVQTVPPRSRIIQPKRRVEQRRRGPAPTLTTAPVSTPAASARGDGVKVLAVRVASPSATIELYCVYSGQAAVADFTELFSLAADEPTFIGSDFNAHHERWGSRQNNRVGRHIATTLADLPTVTLLNTGEPTHVRGGGAGPLPGVAASCCRRDVGPA